MSVTPLGSRTGDAAGAAAQVVDYLDGRSPQRGGLASGPVPDLPGVDPAAGAVGYYADSVEGPGVWLGRGLRGTPLSGPVDVEGLRRVLLGQHPLSGAQLLSARGSAARAEQLGREHARARASGGAAEPLSMAQAAGSLGVSTRYVRRLAAETAQLRDRQAAQRAAGLPVDETPRTFLDATRSSRLGRWRVTRAELARFAAARQAPKAVIGYDLTFSVPKSVSILWAAADARGQEEILAAVRESVEAGIGYLQEHAAFVQAPAGDGGREKAQGLVAAAYLHATSRALDPQLHFHVVVANMAERERDGAMRALDGRALFAHATTASYLAAAELRSQLSRRLGVEWHPVERGIADIAGVPADAIAEMSRRSQAIKDFLDDMTAQLPDHDAGRWVESAAARQMAAYQTRAPKWGDVDPAALRPSWAARLEAVGFGRDALAACLERQAALALVTAEEREGLFAQLGSATGVTHTAATFDRRDVIQHVAEWAGDRLRATEICDLADEWLATEAVVRLDVSRRQERAGDTITLADGRSVRAVGDEALYTTRSMLAAEERILAAYERGRRANDGVVGPDQVAAALAERPELGADQAEMVRSVTTSGHRVQCVVGPAGAGKTTAMAAAVRAWEAAGYRVLGAAVQGTAAEVLGMRAGVESSTVASLLTRLDIGQGARLDARTVVLVDESSTLANRDLSRLMGHVQEASAALRLVGDPAQHSAVAAGGAWRALLERYPDDVATLTEARRQRGAEMAEVRLALGEYRAGKIAEALERVRRDDRIVEASSPDELLDAVVADWYIDRQRRQADPSLAASAMVAEHHVERQELNRRARALLAGEGALQGPVLRTPEAEFQAGDEVIARARDRSLRPEGGNRRSGVTNGLRGTVVEVHPDDGLVVDFERRGRVTVPHEALTRRLRPGVVGVLTHSYAVTSHAAQGDTYQAARHLSTERSSRPGVYVGLSRGVDDCRLYLVAKQELSPPADEHPELPRLRSEATLMEAVTARLRAARQERLAVEVDPDAPAVARLRAAHDVPHLAVLAAAAGPEERVAQRALVDELAARAAYAWAHPEPHLVARLGPRPAGGPARQGWDAAVGGVAVVAARWGPLQPDPKAGPAGWALGARLMGAGDEFTAAAAALRQAEIRFTAGRPAAELVSERTDRETALALNPSERRRDDARSEVSLWQGRLRDRQDDHARAQRRLEDLEAAPRRRRNRQGIEVARRQVGVTDQAVAVAESALGGAEDRLRVAELGAVAQEPVRQRLEIVDAAFEAKVAEAVEQCPRYLDDLLGLRPHNPDKERHWGRDATAIERYRHRVLGVEPDAGPVASGSPLQAAIGDEPDELVAALAWREAAHRLNRDLERGLELGIDL